MVKSISELIDDFGILVEEFKSVSETIRDMGVEEFIRRNLPVYFANRRKLNFFYIEIPDGGIVGIDYDSAKIILKDNKLSITSNEIDEYDTALYFFIPLTNTSVLKYVVLKISKSPIWYNLIKNVYNIKTDFLTFEIPPDNERIFKPNIVESVEVHQIDDNELLFEVTLKTYKVPARYLITSTLSPKFRLIRYALPAVVSFKNLDQFYIKSKLDIAQIYISNHFIVELNKSDLSKEISLVEDTIQSIFGQVKNILSDKETTISVSNPLLIENLVQLDDVKFRLENELDTNIELSAPISIMAITGHSTIRYKI